MTRNGRFDTMEFDGVHTSDQAAPMTSMPASLPVPAGPFRWSTAPWGPVLVCEPLAPHAYHFFSARGLDVAGPHPAPPWDVIGSSLGVPAARVWRMHQVHGIDLTVADAEDPDFAPCPEGDLLVTERDDAALAVRTADCVPILLVDTRRRVVAAVHAGWRGTALGAAAHMVSLLEDRYGVNPSDVLAAIGPSIGPLAYTVGDEVGLVFRRRFEEAAVERWCSRHADGRLRLDLWHANQEQLTDAGVPATQVFVAGLCTATHSDVFHSYRVEKDQAGRMVAGIRLK
jgi:polyphenol oxidase